MAVHGVDDNVAKLCDVVGGGVEDDSDDLRKDLMVLKELDAVFELLGCEIAKPVDLVSDRCGVQPRMCHKALGRPIER